MQEQTVRELTAKEQGYFEKAIELAETALSEGDDGFATVLVGPSGEVLLAEGNRAGTNKNPLSHDTILVVDKAVKTYDKEFLNGCTLYCVLEPCAMCTTAAFWAGIPNIKFAMAESELAEILPGSLEISSREFVKRSPVPMTSEGPYPQLTGAYAVVRKWVKKLGIELDD